ncbi:MAG: hypothetical protein K8F30_03020, partial [Taibaiella sp.]|nr:hypothetical protein [Taibaiella sp.]
NRTGNKQHPIIKVSNLQDNFAIAWYAGGSKIPKEFPWRANAQDSRPIADDTSDKRVAAWRRMLASLRANLFLIDERMSEYVDYTAIPLDLVKNRQRIEARIAEVEALLREG